MSFLLSKMTSSNTSGLADVEGDRLGLMSSSAPAAAKAAFLVKPVDDNLAVKTVGAPLGLSEPRAIETSDLFCSREGVKNTFFVVRGGEVRREKCELHGFGI